MLFNCSVFISYNNHLFTKCWSTVPPSYLISLNNIIITQINITKVYDVPIIQRLPGSILYTAETKIKSISDNRVTSWRLSGRQSSVSIIHISVNEFSFIYVMCARNSDLVRCTPLSLIECDYYKYKFVFLVLFLETAHTHLILARRYTWPAYAGMSERGISNYIIVTANAFVLREV